jgi:hypothetical protein
MEMTLLNLMAKSTVQLVVFDCATKKPIQFGSGCIALYKDRLILLSVNHVTRIKGVKTYTLIETGLPPKEGQGLYYSTGGLIYFDTFKMNGVETGEIERMTISEEDPADITFTGVKKDIQLFQKGFVYNGFEIEDGPRVFPALEESTTPLEKDCFGYFGYIKQEIIDDKILKAEVTFKLDLKYQGTYNRFHLFNTPEEIRKKEDYEGTSGAPIFNSDGQLVGLVCSVNEGSKSLFAFPIDYCRSLIDISIECGML